MEKKENSAVVILSGGQDSVTCLYWAKRQFDKVEAITFNYGQKHSVELVQSQKICKVEGVKQTIVDISFLGTIVDSALTSNKDVNEKTERGVPASFVPNRNQLFITLAHAYAQKIGATNLVTGVCQTDYSGYADCRQEYIDSIEKATNLGSFGKEYLAKKETPAIKIHTPLMNLSKKEIWALAAQLCCLEIVRTESHTCYNGNREKLNDWGFGCDACPACELRKNGYNEYVKSVEPYL